MNTKIRWLRNKLMGLNLQGMIITNPINIRYLTNIEAEGILLITRKENIFLINIIATLDLRKRFIVRGKPVMKIKILR